MRYIKSVLQTSGLLLMMICTSSCVDKQNKVEEKALDAAAGEVNAVEQKQMDKPSLPRQYQRPAYMIGDEIQVSATDEADEVALKVGATIRSTAGPQPLWDILKRLAAMKDLNVSWESDVDQNLLVDVDINANDDFFKAVNNLLRQVDYFHEMQDSTIVVKYKETRQYQIGMPYVKQLFETGAGGNVLGGNDAAENIEGTIRLDSKGNEFDIWANIEENINAILNVWTTEAVTAEIEETETDQTESGSNQRAAAEGRQQEAERTAVASTRRRSGNENFYTIDKNIGLITVTAPRPLLDKLGDYIASLKSHLYKQISIEAKIIEVELTKESNIGIDWSNVLKNFGLTGSLTFGDPTRGGQLYPYIFAEGNDRVVFDDGSYTDRTYDPTRFISKITLNARPFDVFLNALKEEGTAKVLSNPKISVLNGQPALITVGRNVTYVDNIESDLDSDSGVVTLTVNTERILSGVGMALTATIIDDDEVIMNLTPVTSELQEPIQNIEIGTFGAQVGLPIINIREMSSTVKVKSGEMLVIGGLISEDKDEESAFAPVLGDIPLIKYLFGNETKRSTKRELIILLKPVIM